MIKRIILKNERRIRCCGPVCSYVSKKRENLIVALMGKVEAVNG